MKIEIRKLTPSHLYMLTSALDKETAELANIDWPFTRKVAEQFINEFNTWGVWINNGSLVGAIEVKENLETAYFVKKGWRNLGIGTEAVKQCKELFGDKQLWCVIEPDNKASLRVAQKSAIRVKFI
jgi:RimJ/RimL family protein N-acetyltransferase